MFNIVQKSTLVFSDAGWYHSVTQHNNRIDEEFIMIEFSHYSLNEYNKYKNWYKGFVLVYSAIQHIISSKHMDWRMRNRRYKLFSSFRRTKWFSLVKMFKRKFWPQNGIMRNELSERTFAIHFFYPQCELLVD